MAKTKKVEKELESIVSGHYSVRTVHGNGDVDFIIDWKQLALHVNDAITTYNRAKLVEEAPYHPGYEGAVIEPTLKTKKSRKKS